MNQYLKEARVTTERTDEQSALPWQRVRFHGEAALRNRESDPAAGRAARLPPWLGVAHSHVATDSVSGDLLCCSTHRQRLTAVVVDVFRKADPAATTKLYSLALRLPPGAEVEERAVEAGEHARSLGTWSRDEQRRRRNADGKMA